MAGKSGGGGPPPTNATSTANTQYQYNQRAARDTNRANSYNISGPTGNVTWSYDSAGNPTTQNIMLSETGQQIFNKQQGLQNTFMDRASQNLGAVSGSFSNSGMPYDPSQMRTDGMSQLDTGNVVYTPGLYGNLTDYTSQVGDAFMGSQRAKMSPIFDDQRAKLANDLQQRGIPVGSEAHTKAMSQLDASQNTSWEQAARNATMASGQEASRIFGMEQQLGNTDWSRRFQAQQQNRSDWQQEFDAQNKIHQNSVQDELTERNQNLGEMWNYYNNTQLQMPTGYQRSSVNVSSPDYSGYANNQYSQEYQRYRDQQQRNASIWGAVGSAAQTGASLYMWSSRDMKTDDGPAEAFLDRVARLPIRAWRYLPLVEPGQPLHVGPYAEDWAELFGGDGLRISIQDAIGVCLKCIQELRQRVAALAQSNERALVGAFS